MRLQKNYREHRGACSWSEAVGTSGSRWTFPSSWFLVSDTRRGSNLNKFKASLEQISTHRRTTGTIDGAPHSENKLEIRLNLVLISVIQNTFNSITNTRSVTNESPVLLTPGLQTNFLFSDFKPFKHIFWYNKKFVWYCK